MELYKGKKGYYNLACAQARLGELDEALESLQKSIDNVERVTVEPWRDNDLESLRHWPHIDRFMRIFGPPSEDVEEKPRAKRKAKPKSTKPKK
ncbi:tetratricopeptide repeat protein [candidate division WOR-3 bacterium]|nr:tetratricopeptide repeat protein [candidate division WOR-3 bacterium]